MNFIMMRCVVLLSISPLVQSTSSCAPDEQALLQVQQLVKRSPPSMGHRNPESLLQDPESLLEDTESVVVDELVDDDVDLVGRDDQSLLQVAKPFPRKHSGRRRRCPQMWQCTPGTCDQRAFEQMLKNAGEPLSLLEQDVSYPTSAIPGPGMICFCGDINQAKHCAQARGHPCAFDCGRSEGKYVPDWEWTGVISNFEKNSEGTIKIDIDGNGADITRVWTLADGSNRTRQSTFKQSTSADGEIQFSRHGIRFSGTISGSSFVGKWYTIKKEVQERNGRERRYKKEMGEFTCSRTEFN